MTAFHAPWKGLAYRAHDPRWSFDACSGEGARLKGGRFNRVGTPALYLALRPEGALREAQAGFPFRFQPMTLCACEVAAERIVDARRSAALAEAEVTFADLACAWRLDFAEGRVPGSWLAVDKLVSRGAQGMLYPSFALAATAEDINLVLWRWNAEDCAHVRVIDDERRLAGGGSS